MSDVSIAFLVGYVVGCLLGIATVVIVVEWGDRRGM